MFSTDSIISAIIFGRGKNGGDGGGGSRFSYAVCSGASDTPEGVSFYKGSSVITGTLSASSAEIGKIYLVPTDNGENDSYDEYIAVRTAQDDTAVFSWERVGNSTISVGVTGVKGSAESNYRSGEVNLTKANIGLSEVDNTSDLNKPISTATQAELNKRYKAETMIMAEYEALTQEQKMDGTLYFITDADSLPDAGGVGF